MPFIFWFTVLFVSYTYIFYPMLLYLLAVLRPKPIRKESPVIWPAVSVVIAAKDEEQRIGGRLENLLQQKYPGTLEVIVVSDGSTDHTVDIARSSEPKFQSRGWDLNVLEYGPSKGKPFALNLGVSKAKGQLIVFADSRQKFDPNAIRELVENFSDKEIGAVSGELLFVESYDSQIETAMGAYWKYEKMVRKLESKTGSVTGATGAIYAIRSELYKPIPKETLLDDVLIPLNIIQQGYRVIFDSTARAFDVVSKDVESEWKRKVRTLAGNWQLISIAPYLFNPFTNKQWWRLMSHKIFRLLVPFCLPLLLVSSIFSPGLFYKACAFPQAIFYASVVMAWKYPQLQQISLVKLCYFFFMLNMAAVAGFFYWITGRTEKIWG